MSPEQYLKELKSHDWYYNYSDDHSVWTKGRNNAHRLQAIAAEIGILGKMFDDYSRWVFMDRSDRENTPEPTLENYIKK
jgi:hypothetical protein